jgi:hypothetical protein
MKKKNYAEIEELAALVFIVTNDRNRMAEYWIYVVRVLTCVFHVPVTATFDMA